MESSTCLWHCCRLLFIHTYSFIYRLLGLAPEWQMCIFDFYQATLEALIDKAKKDGRYDEGIVDVKGTSITLSAAPQVHRLSCDTCI